MSYSSEVGVFDYNWLVANIFGTCVQVFAYGIYFNLFLLSLHTFHRRKLPGNHVLLASTWAMGILATVQIVLRLVRTAVVIRFVGASMGMDQELTPSPTSLPGTYNALSMAQVAVFVLNNMVTDTLFLYRCYVIWGSRKVVLVLPAILILATCVTGFAGLPRDNTITLTESIAVMLGTAANFCLMILTAGRLWWLRRNARLFANKELINRYTTVMAMILESGVLYFIPAMLVNVVAPWNVPFALLEGLGTYLINIIPTLIIVRVGLRSVDGEGDRPTDVTPMREAMRARIPARGSGDSSVPVLDIRSRGEQESIV
ncbi:hypothetical protein C8R46DRAFT_1194832 [Mycena filopes]|nr:hypothetical protein C8R46DRAFT_1194832 [Mycena filopes]